MDKKVAQAVLDSYLDMPTLIASAVLMQQVQEAVQAEVLYRNTPRELRKGTGHLQGLVIALNRAKITSAPLCTTCAAALILLDALVSIYGAHPTAAKRIAATAVKQQKEKTTAAVVVPAPDAAQQAAEQDKEEE